MPVEAARVHLEHGQIAHTETTLNYRITKIYEGDKLVKSLVYDVHSNKKIENCLEFSPKTDTQEHQSASLKHWDHRPAVIFMQLQLLWWWKQWYGSPRER